MKIIHQVLLFFILPIFILFLSVLFIAANSYQEQSADKINTTLKFQHIQNRDYFLQELKNFEKSLNLFKLLLKNAPTDRKELRFLFRSFINSDNELISLSLVDLEGKVQLKVSEYETNNQLKSSSIANDLLFKSPLQNNNIYFSWPRIDTNSKQKIIDIAIAYRKKNDEKNKGVIVASFLLQNIQSNLILSSPNETISGLFNKSKWAELSNKQANIEQYFNSSKPLLPEQLQLNGVSYHPMKHPVHYRNFNAILIKFIPQSYFKQELEFTLKKVKRVGYVALLILIIGVLIFTRYMTHTINKTTSKILSKTHFHSSNKRENELKALYKAFLDFEQEITEQQAEIITLNKELKELNNDLETRVDVRTKELALAKEEAEHSNQAKSDFLSSMSHELRTPLNAIIGFSQLLHLDDKLPEMHKENVFEIEIAGKHLLELINEVLDLAKIESGRIDVLIEKVDILQVLENCINLVEPIAQNKNISISFTDFEGIYVRADKFRLRQALINLLSNAIKYNNLDGKVELRTNILNNRSVQIHVTDTGPGIPEDRLDELFQPFKRLEAENSEIEGTGIGLTLTKRIIELMEGSIGVNSRLGYGSNFWIELPLDSLSIPQSNKNFRLEHNSIDNKKIATEETDTKYTILYIEDNPANLKLVSQILALRSNVCLYTTHRPSLGLELAKAKTPDLILLDINLPEMNGYQVLDLLKQDSELTDKPVIAITANAMSQDIEKGNKSAFSDYLTKPLDLKLFNLTIDKYLN